MQGKLLKQTLKSQFVFVTVTIYLYITNSDFFQTMRETENELQTLHKPH